MRNHHDDTLLDLGGMYDQGEADFDHDQGPGLFASPHAWAAIAVSVCAVGAVLLAVFA